MQPIEIVSLVLRWFHILAGMTAVGGMIFIRFVIVPSMGAISTDSSQALHGQMRPRWAKIVAAAIGLLLITGFANYLIAKRIYDLPKWYDMLWGIKFLIAMVIFAISSLLAGKTALAEKLRKNMRVWLNLNIFLAVVVVCMSGLLKVADHKPKGDKPPVAEAPSFR